jgi:hypothetical protein
MFWNFGGHGISSVEKRSLGHIDARRVLHLAGNLFQNRRHEEVYVRRGFAILFAPPSERFKGRGYSSVTTVHAPGRWPRGSHDPPPISDSHFLPPS